jgi:hypothetical protein
VGPRAILEGVVKRKIPSPRRKSNLGIPIFLPVAQRYTPIPEKKSATTRQTHAPPPFCQQCYTHDTINNVNSPENWILHSVPSLFLRTEALSRDFDKAASHLKVS